MSDIVISSTTRATILTLQRTQGLIDRTTQRLATGLKVNSALDDPQNYFAARALRNESNDYNRIIDGIGQSARSIQEALIGTDAISSLLNLGESVVTESRQKLITEQTDQAVFIDEIDTSPPSLSSQILSALPDVYYQLNDAGPTATDSGFGGGVNATYTGGVTTGAPSLYTNGGNASASFDGNNDRVRIDDSGLINVGTKAAKTVELVFNANDINSRQILYEEGGGTHSFNMYIDNGRLHITGRNQGVWGPSTPGGPTNISIPITAGETYHAAFVFSQAENRFEGFLNGSSINDVPVGNAIFPSHNGNIGIGGINQAVWFDDVSSNANSGFNFDGNISDVAIYTRALTDPEILSHGTSLNASTTELYKHRDFENILDQIDQITIDARYRGINLLEGDDLTTNFNPQRTSALITEGQNLTSAALDIPRFNFNVLEDIDAILEAVRIAREDVRGYTRSLANDLNIIQTREEFTENKINTLESGADKLTLADVQEETANQLSLETRQALAVQSLSLATQTEQQVLSLF